MASDDPTELVRTARSMAGMASGPQRQHPWWVLAQSVEALVKIAEDNDELRDVATVALQVMASVYNEKTGVK